MECIADRVCVYKRHRKERNENRANRSSVMLLIQCVQLQLESQKHVVLKYMFCVLNIGRELECELTLNAKNKKKPKTKNEKRIRATQPRENR